MKIGTIAQEQLQAAGGNGAAPHPWIRAAGWSAAGVVLAGFCWLPQIADNYILSGVILAVVFLFPALGLNIIFGYAGMLSFAQGAFFGIGAYVSAILSSRLGLSFWSGLAAAIPFTALIAALLAVPALRLSRFSFVMVTLGFVLIAQTVAGNWVGLTQGHMGIINIPRPALGLGDQRIVLSSVRSYYYLCIVLAAIGLAVALAIVSSPLGRCFRAVRDNELLAAAYGIPVNLIKTVAFSLSAAFAAVGGVIEVHYLTIASPALFDFYYTNAFLIIVLAGGRGSFWAVPVATAAFIITSQVLSIAPEQQLVVMGVLLVALVFWLPGGFGPLFAAQAKKLSAKFGARK